MALLWVESFDDDFGNATAYTQKGWTLVSGSAFTAAAAGRWQGTALRGTAATPAVFRTPNLGNASTMIVGFSFRGISVVSVTFSETKLATFVDGTTEQLSLWVLGDSGKFKFRIKRGSTTIATTTNSWGAGYWIWLELKVVFDTTGSNGSVELKVNTASEILVENIDTTNHSSTIANAVELAVSDPTGGTNLEVDDFFVLDGTGGSLNNFLGDRIVEGKSPNAAGNRNQWNVAPSGTHQAAVDDPQINDDTDYLWVPNTSDGLVELFGFEDLTAITGTVDAVFLYWDLRMDTAGQDKVRPIFRNAGGTEATGTEVTIDEDASYVRFKQLFTQDPTIAGAWTVTNFNAMQMGLESRAA